MAHRTGRTNDHATCPQEVRACRASHRVVGWVVAVAGYIALDVASATGLYLGSRGRGRDRSRRDPQTVFPSLALVPVFLPSETGNRRGPDWVPRPLDRAPRRVASDYASAHGTAARRLARGHRPMFPLPAARESDCSRRRTARAVARRRGRGPGRERSRDWETLRRACRREPSCGARSRRYRCGISSFHECDAVLSGQGCHSGRIQSPVYGSS